MKIIYKLTIGSLLLGCFAAHATESKPTNWCGSTGKTTPTYETGTSKDPNWLAKESAINDVLDTACPKLPESTAAGAAVSAVERKTLRKELQKGALGCTRARVNGNARNKATCDLYYLTLFSPTWNPPTDAEISQQEKKY